MSINWEDLTDFTDISSGMFGVVRRADYLGTDVAVKEFLDLADQPGFDLQKYIGREVEILKACRHPNVVMMMGVCVHETKVYLITELVTGGNLKAWIKSPKGDASWRLRVSFATDIARALVYLHAHKIIHRDLKSENLLITENYRLKICDFGLSREVATTKEERRRLSFCGTPGYTAPEIELGMDFDERVDIFSYGVIICEIITMSIADDEKFRRSYPYLGIDPESIVPDAGCPPELLQIAIHCTDADPDKRPKLKDCLQTLRKLEAELSREQPVNLGVLRTSSIYSMNSIDDSGSSSHSLQRSRSVAASQTDLDLSKLSFGSSPDVSFSPEENVPLSPSTPTQATVASPSRRIGHFVPHRFSLAGTPSLRKCDLCHKRVGLGQKYLVCDDCSELYHKVCAARAPATCGLPADLRTSIALLDPKQRVGSRAEGEARKRSNEDRRNGRDIDAII